MSPRSYRQDLRANREAFVGQLREKYGALPKDVERSYLRKAMAIQNETRGKLGELFGEVSLTGTGASHEADIIRDSKVFETPFGDRRIDVWDTKRAAALEVKSGYTCLSRFVRAQVAKDAYLLETSVARTVCWRFLQGASRPLLDKLAEHNIEAVLGWPDFGQSGEGLSAAIDMIARSASLSKGELK